LQSLPSKNDLHPIGWYFKLPGQPTILCYMLYHVTCYTMSHGILCYMLYCHMVYYATYYCHMIYYAT